MPTTTPQITILFATKTAGVVTTGPSFTVPLDASNPKAWQDLLAYLIAHPELLLAFLQLLAMLLGQITPPPPPTP